MFGSLFPHSDSTFGLLIDIGSGSTLTSVVESKRGALSPIIIWSSREHQPLRANATAEQLTKAITTSLVNASLAINTGALRALQAANEGARITSVQVTVAAPWSYTIPQTINYQPPESTRVTPELIEDLTVQADQKVTENVRAQTAINSLGLAITHRLTTNIAANGYTIEAAMGQPASTVSLTQLSAVVRTYLIDAVKDIHQKTLPHTSLLITSTMLALYESLRTYRPGSTLVGIISVGYEATEIGVIRDGELRFTTHTPVGLYTLARQLAEQTDLPVGEIFGAFGSPEPLNFATHVRDAKKTLISAILDTYEQSLQELFLETGDGLTLPPTLLLNCEPAYMPFLAPLITKAAKTASQTSHSMEQFTTYLSAHRTTTSHSPDGTALATAQFFHMTQQKESESH